MHLYIADFDVIDEIALHFNIKETVLTEKEGKSIFFSVAKNERFLKSKDLYRIIPLRIDQMNSLESISSTFSVASIPFYVFILNLYFFYLYFYYIFLYFVLNLN